MDLQASLCTIDPAFAFAIGILIGVCAVLMIMRLRARPKSASDPLSALFSGDTLDKQLARLSQSPARFEHETRAMCAIRAKIFAKASAQERAKGPHHAKRYDHAAVLDHIAKVMRAGTEHQNGSAKGSEGHGVSNEAGIWEEIALLPPPGQDASTNAKAA